MRKRGERSLACASWIPLSGFRILPISCRRFGDRTTVTDISRLFEWRGCRSRKAAESAFRRMSVGVAASGGWNVVCCRGSVILNAGEFTLDLLGNFLLDRLALIGRHGLQVVLGQSA